MSVQPLVTSARCYALVATQRVTTETRGTVERGALTRCAAFVTELTVKQLLVVVVLCFVHACD